MNYLHSITISVVATAMSFSSLPKVRQIPYKTGLVVLRNSVAGSVTSSKDHRASQVYGAGIAARNMSRILNTTQLKITVYHILTGSCNLKSRSHLSSLWSSDHLPHLQEALILMEKPS